MKYIDDDNKLYQKYLNKKNNASKENIGFNLSFNEFCLLVKEAGLKSSDLGFSGKKYVLARYNDEGDYQFDNCRFITQSENMKERKMNQNILNALRNNAKKMNEINKNTSQEVISERIKNGIKGRKKSQKRKNEAIKNQIEKDKLKNQSYVKEHNSQYKTFWITNGSTNKKWREEYGNLPNGFYKGRINNW